MSKHFAQPHSTVLHDSQTMSNEELESAYNIEIDDDGTVWDPCESWTFDSVREWAQHIWRHEKEAAEYSAASQKHTRSAAHDDY